MQLNSEQRAALLALARQSIGCGLEAERWVVPPELPAALTAPAGSFVTLRIGSRLRGSCGNLAAERSLGLDVWCNAWAAAFADTRFTPLEADEWPDVRIDISVPGELQVLPITDEQALLAALHPGSDGLLLEKDGKRAVFLPEVWQQIPEPAEFVRHLKQKAGWPADAWSPRIQVQRFSTLSFAEPGAEPGLAKSDAAAG
jgi:AmmeMemoRadiSam system protein A